MSDKHSINKIKGFILVRVLRYLASKEIDQDTINKIILGISDAFTDAQEKHVLVSLKLALAKFVLGINTRIGVLDGRETKEQTAQRCVPEDTRTPQRTSKGTGTQNKGSTLDRKKKKKRRINRKNIRRQNKH